MKAIETTYKGYRFRSRLEARWAVFLDAMHLAWSYEPEGIETPAGRYLPDFWLPGLGLLLEVKPEAPTERERAKAGELLLASRKPVFIAAGLPDAPGEVHWSYTSLGGEWNHQHAPGWVDWNISRALGACQLEVVSNLSAPGAQHDHAPARILKASRDIFGYVPVLTGPAREALSEAKGARFEFGESGGPGG